MIRIIEWTGQRKIMDRASGNRGGKDSQRMNDLPEAPTELSNGIAPAWHTLDSETVLYLLMSRMAGLTGTQANERLSRHGSNELPPPSRRHPAMRLLAQFHNTLIYFLLAAAIAAFALGHV